MALRLDLWPQMTAYHLRGQSQQGEAKPDLSGLEPFPVQEALVLSRDTAGLWEEERHVSQPQAWPLWVQIKRSDSL